MGRTPQVKVEGFTREEKKKILAYIHIEHWSVMNYCKEIGISRQWLYQVLNARTLNPNIKAKFQSMLKEEN